MTNPIFDVQRIRCNQNHEFVTARIPETETSADLILSFYVYSHIRQAKQVTLTYKKMKGKHYESGLESGLAKAKEHRTYIVIIVAR